MTQTLIIAAREIRERTFVLLVAAFIAVFPFLMASTPSGKRFGRLEMIAAVGAFGAIAFVIVVAIILGASIVGRELTERRLSFYFSRPIHGSTIWFGKLLGGLVLAVVCFAMIFVPSYLVGREKWDRAFSMRPATIATATLIAILILFLVAHAISTIIRSRSPLAGVDLLAAAISGGIVWVIVASLAQALALELATTVAKTLVGALALILIGAGAWQLSRGRADAKRNHLEMSKFLWVSLAIVLAVVGAYTLWVFSAEVDDLKNPEGLAGPTGEWAVVGGLSPMRGDFHSTFVMNLANGNAVRLPIARFAGPEFSRGGKAVITEAGPTGWRGTAKGEVILYRFGRDERPLRTGIAEVGGVVMSDDLNRVAVFGSTSVSVHEIDSQRLVGSAPMPQRRGSARGFFVTPDVLRILIVEKTTAENDVVDITLRIFEFNTMTRRMAQTGTWTTTGAQLIVHASADGSALLVNRFGKVEGSRLAILDGRTGALRASRPAGIGGFLGARFLSDGRVAVMSADTPRLLQILTADGTHVRDVPLGPS
ncbi:MAG: ABC transporter permease, partial [Thermoanaerobaculia bacterium]